MASKDEEHGLKRNDYGSISIPGNLDHRGTESNSCLRKIFPLGFRPESKRLLHLAWPLLITQLTVVMMPLLTIVFCGHLGAAALGAASIATSVINFTSLTTGWGIVLACDTFFSQSFGSANKKQTGVYLQKALLIVILACFPCWAIHINTEVILRAIGQDPEVARLAGRFLMYYIPAVLFSFFYQVLLRYIQTQNIVLPSVLIGIAGTIVNVGLQYLLVYTLDMRTDGSALAQVGTNFVLFIMVLLYILISKCYKETWDGWSIDCLQHWDFFAKLAIPGIFMMGLGTWCFECGTLLAGTLGETSLAVQAICLYLEAIGYQIPTVIGIAGSIRIGQFLGSGDAKGAINCTRVVCTFALMWGAIAVILYSTLRYHLPKMFSQDPYVIEEAAHVMPILAIGCVFDSFLGALGGVLRGCGRQVAGAMVVFLGYWVVALPIGIPLMLMTSLTVKGLWLGYMVGIIVAGVVFGALVLTTNWELEAQQAQVRAGIRQDPILEAEEAKKLEEAIMEEAVITEETQGLDDKVAPPTDRRDEKTSLLPRRKVSSHVPLATNYRKLVRNKSDQPPSKESRTGLRRVYSQSAIITALQGRRFSAHHSPEKLYVLPSRERRFSTTHTPQIQKDIIRQVEQADKHPIKTLLFVRVLTLLSFVAILVAGILIRVYVTVPHETEIDCISPQLGNATVPPNNLLPYCNTTTNKT